MKWKNRRSSQNIEDRRGRSPIARAGKGGGLVTIIIVLVAMYLGVDPQALLQLTDNIQGGSVPQTSRVNQADPAQAELAQFVGVVLADTEDVWHQQFRKLGKTYVEPKLVMFSGAVQSACGSAQSAMGPFYCPADQKAYIDLDFYQDLRDRHRAPGDFAQAYVIAHEVGHHVQNLLGISGQVHQAKRQMSKIEGNKLSVKLELQADCFAGIWAHDTQRAKQVLEQGDLSEALTAASAIGDDRLQKQASGRIRPESFTHGSSKQRVDWFKKGWETGDFSQCNTFGT